MFAPFFMNPLGGDFVIAGSGLFNGTDGYLTRTPPAGNSKTFTISCVFKRSELSAINVIFVAGDFSGAYLGAYFNAADQLIVEDYTGSGGVFNLRLDSNQVFRDLSAWYHMVIKYNSTAGTPSASDNGVFINGTQLTSFSTATYPDQNDTSSWNTNVAHRLGWGVNVNSAYYLNAYVAQFAHIEGQALNADSFGEFNDGYWQINDPSGLTFGTNGFLLEGSNGLSNYPIATADMTGASAPSGDVTSSHAEGSEPNWHAFDQNASTYWGVSGQSGVATLTYQFDSPKTIAAYNLQNRSGGTSGGPVAFKIQGSNNGSDFTDLHSVTGQSYSAGEKKGYNFSNSTAYSYYRLNISASNSNEGPTIAEWEMFETQDTSGNGQGFIKSGTITATNDSGTNGDA